MAAAHAVELAAAPQIQVFHGMENQAIFSIVWKIFFHTVENFRGEGGRSCRGSSDPDRKIGPCDPLTEGRGWIRKAAGWPVREEKYY